MPLRLLILFQKQSFPPVDGGAELRLGQGRHRPLEDELELFYDLRPEGWKLGRDGALDGEEDEDDGVTPAWATRDHEPGWRLGTLEEGEDEGDEFGGEGMETDDDYSIKTREPLEPGMYAFHTQGVLTSVDTAALDKLPSEMRVAFPFEVR